MKIKYLFLLLIFAFLHFSANAQFGKWLDKTKRAISNNKTVKKVERAVEEYNPKEAITRKLNENFNTNNYVNEIKNKYNDINNLLSNNTSFYNDNNLPYTESFKDSGEVNILLTNYFGKPVRINPVEVAFNGDKYKVSNINEVFFASNNDKIPLNKDFPKIIKASYWAYKAETVNTEYVQNINQLSKYISEFYGYTRALVKVAFNFFDKINNLEYGGVSVLGLIQEYGNQLGYNISMSDINNEFVEMDGALQEIQQQADDISADCQAFLIAKSEVENSNIVDYQKVENSLLKFRDIQQKLNLIADNIHKQKISIDASADNFSQLSDFYGISLIENIGDMYRSFGDYYLTMENGTRQYAESIGHFESELNDNSSNYFSNSKDIINDTLNIYIKRDLKGIAKYQTLYKNIKKDKLFYYKKDRFVRYLAKVSKKYSRLKKAKRTDLVDFDYYRNDLIDMYESFPTKSAKQYYKKVLTEIDNKQIVGGSYLDNNYDDFQKAINSLKNRPSNISRLIAKQKLLPGFYKKAESANTTFFVVLGVLLLGGIIALVLKFK